MKLFSKELNFSALEKKIKNRVKRQMEKTQREYYLNEQMKAIQKELGDGEDGSNEYSEICLLSVIEKSLSYCGFDPPIGSINVELVTLLFDTNNGSKNVS